MYLQDGNWWGGSRVQVFYAVVCRGIDSKSIKSRSRDRQNEFRKKHEMKEKKLKMQIVYAIFTIAFALHHTTHYDYSDWMHLKKMNAIYYIFRCTYTKYEHNSNKLNEKYSFFWATATAAAANIHYTIHTNWTNVQREWVSDRRAHLEIK